MPDPQPCQKKWTTVREMWDRECSREREDETIKREKVANIYKWE